MEASAAAQSEGGGALESVEGAASSAATGPASGLPSTETPPTLPPPGKKTPSVAATNEEAPSIAATNKKACASDTGALLSRASLEEMLPRNFKNGLAWWGCDASYGVRSGGVWAHGGFMQGVRTHVYLWPERSVSVVVLTNGEDDYLRAVALVCGVLGIPSENLC